MASEQIDGFKKDIKRKSRNPKIEFDRLQMYFGDPYVIDLEDAAGSISVLQPTLGDVIAIGEKRFYQTLNIFTTNTTANRLMLWENGIDWNELPDYLLFTMLYRGADQDVVSLLLKDIDLQCFKRVIKYVGLKEIVTLYDSAHDIEINEMVYHHICQYLRAVFNSYPDEKITKNSILKQWYIDKDKRQRVIDEEQEKKGKGKESYSIQPLISAYLNHPGTKYKLKELKEVGICEFYDSIQRLQIYESTTACMKGLYSGMIDGKRISPDEYNFMKDIK